MSCPCGSTGESSFTGEDPWSPRRLEVGHRGTMRWVGAHAEAPFPQSEVWSAGSPTPAFVHVVGAEGVPDALIESFGTSNRPDETFHAKLMNVHDAEKHLRKSITATRVVRVQGR